MAEEQKFPSEIIDLPSQGKVYSEDSVLRDGKIEIKYMTAREEDILTSANLIKKGVVVEKLLNSLIMTQGVTTDDLVTGDKNAVMVAARILAYGPEYRCEFAHPTTGEQLQHTFNLADCPFKTIPSNVTENKFEFKLPISKKKVTFKLLNGKEEISLNEELKANKKSGSSISRELTTRLRYTITSVDGDESQNVINNFVNNMLAKDSMVLRQEIKRISPDIELKQEVEHEGETVTVDIPMTVNFFWPNS